MERMRNEKSLFVWDSSLRLASPNSKLNRMTNGVIERIYESPLSFYDIPPLSRGDKIEVEQPPFLNHAIIA